MSLEVHIFITIAAFASIFVSAHKERPDCTDDTQGVCRPHDLCQMVAGLAHLERGVCSIKVPLTDPPAPCLGFPSLRMAYARSCDNHRPPFIIIDEKLAYINVSRQTETCRTKLTVVIWLYCSQA